MNGKGKTKRLIFDSKNKVLKALMQKSPQTWTGLLRATGLSSRTLQKTLKRLMKEGLISRKLQVAEKYPPPVLYGLTEKGLDATTPILFAVTTWRYCLGIRQEPKQTSPTSFEIAITNEYKKLAPEETLQIMARRFFARSLYALLKAVETNKDSYFHLISENPMALVLPKEYAGNIENIGFEDLKKFLTPQRVSEFKAILQKAFPRETQELETLFQQLEETRAKMWAEM